MKKTIRFTVKAKDCTKVFKKGLKPGVLAYKDLEYDITTKESKSAMFAMELLKRQKEILEENFEVTFEEVKGN